MGNDALESIAARLREEGHLSLERPRQNVIPFTGDPAADVLTSNIEEYPHAYLIASLSARQVPSNVAWTLPAKLRERVGSFDFSALRELSEDEMISIVLAPPALHRFGKDIAGCIYAALERIGQQYGGDASRIWSDIPQSDELVKRFLAFKGIGPKIAGMAANVLVKAFKVPVADRSGLDMSVDVHVRRVMKRMGFVAKDASDKDIVVVGRELNPEYPAIIDLPVWRIGIGWCKPKHPRCEECSMGDLCPRVGIE